MGMLAAFAVLGLTSCDGEADHYYVFFGPITPADPGPSCTSWCVKTEAFNTGGSFHVHKGQKVRFVNLATEPVSVELMYKPVTGQVTSEKFFLTDGASKKIKITQQMVDNQTTIEVTYKVGTGPTQGGPHMIVHP
jgi:hypothetical protein